MDTAEPLIERETPDPGPSREALVQKWQDDVVRAKRFWKPAFDRMFQDMRFAAGYQWPGQKENDDRYVANVVLRHIQQRVAVVYGKNPKILARRRERLTSSVWDGSFTSLQNAMANPLAPGSMELLMEAQKVALENRMLDSVGKTLEILYNYSVDEQALPFKPAMKTMVRRTLTTGVGYVKIGFQRVMKMRPEVDKEIADISSRLATLERLSADLAEGEILPDAAEAEQLRLTLQALQSEPMSLVREGLVFDYPDSTAIIPDPRTKQLRGFVGAGWVAEEFLLTADDIKEVYKKDVSEDGNTTAYRRLSEFAEPTPEMFTSSNDDNKSTKSLYKVWQIYSRKDGLVYTVCDGYKDFLEEPAAPDVYMERFYPWFVFTTNEVYSPNTIFPPSDVRLIRDMQLEINRARQGTREHRRANRPKIIVAAGALDDEDMDKLTNHPANAIIELNAIQPGQSVDSVLQAMKPPPLDPALYDTNIAYEDILRVVGVQEANLGGTSGATATESSIAEGSRMSALSSTVDDLDELLTEIARTAGQVLLSNVQTQTVVEVVGPGAVWPELNRDQIAKEIYLDVEAASTGRPNKAAEVQVAQQLFPLLMQLPGIPPEWLAKELIRRLDDRINPSDAYVAGLPSIQSLNKPAPAPAGQPGQPQEKSPESEPTQINNAPRPQITGQANPMSPDIGDPTGAPGVSSV